jgi:beta-N-acetylhexosaminidase
MTLVTASVDRAELRRSIATTLMPGFAGTTLPEWLAERLRNGLGAVCVFGPNIVSRRQLRQLTDAIHAANPLAVIAIDEEGGDVTRLYYSSGSPYPGNAVLGRLDDPDHTASVARRVGWELRQAGCTLTFGPDVDVNSNADNPVIGVRSFGTDPARVAVHSAAWVRGVQSTGVAASPKHFPGHGDTAQDSHLALPIVDAPPATLHERELVPFVSAIAAGGKTVMTSHILLPQVDPVNPATFSPLVLQGMLRGELGFDGVIVSDALDMAGASGLLGIPGAAVAALAAGCDLLCIGTDNTAAQLDEIEAAVFAAIDAGRLDPARVADAAGRVLRLAVETAAAADAIPIPGFAADEPEFDLQRVIGSFELNVHAAEWLRAAPDACSVIRLETVANIAVGMAPWGPFAELTVNPDGALAEAWRSHPVVTCTAASSASPSSVRGDHGLVLAALAPVLVIGKDIHRHAFARDIIDRLRADGRDVLTVDMGWPSDDRAYADIATFGASRLLGRALLTLLAGSEARGGASRTDRT